MQPLTLDDLTPLAEYVARRSEHFAANSRYLDRYRRVRVGPSLTVIFENRQTLLFRVHEFLRIARMTDSHRIQRELELYNRLLPRRRSLQASLIIDVSEGQDCSRQLSFWSTLRGNCIKLSVGGRTVPARIVTDREEDLTIGTAHWLNFSVEEPLQCELANPRSIAAITAEHRNYCHQSTPFSDAIRASLIDDLVLSERDQAA